MAFLNVFGFCCGKNPSHCFTLDMSGAGLALQPLRRAVACMTSMGNPEGNASGGFGMKIGN